MAFTTLVILLATEFGIVHLARRRAIRRGKTPKPWHYPMALGLFGAVLFAVTLLQHS